MTSFKLTLLTLIMAALAAGSAFAQTTPADDTLYRQLGGQTGVARLSDEFLQRLLADPRMNPFFRETEPQEFKTQLADQLCEVSGGPCKRKGKDMKTLHSGQDITKSNFNALVEVLQQSMDAQGIPFSAQNKLLAKLAPMHREIVNVP